MRRNNDPEYKHPIQMTMFAVIFFGMFVIEYLGMGQMGQPKNWGEAIIDAVLVNILIAGIFSGLGIKRRRNEDRD